MWPRARTPALVGLRLRFACGETARAVIGLTGADVLAYPAFASLKRGPSANNPALVAIRLHFAARNRAYGYRPHLLGLPRKIRRGISLRETTLCGCPLRGHGFATPHRYFAVPVTAAPRRGPNGKTPAPFGYFLNTKKVTPSADFAIGPAKAEAFLFSHTRLPFPPRPLLPFGRISPAAKPGWPVIGPAGAGAEAALPKAPPLTLPAQGPASRDFR